MKNNDLLRAFDCVDDDILERSEISLAKTKKKRTMIVLRWGIVAACIMLAACLTGAVYAAETREYTAAVEFFELNGLSMEGLSRSDVKAVYRDITTNHFTYDKTADVLMNSITGLEIYQREPTPEELAGLWNSNILANDKINVGVRYEFDYEYKRDNKLGFDVLDKSVVKCYNDGKLLWTLEFCDYYAEKCLSTSVGTVVYGRNDTWSSEQQIYPFLAMVDENGKLMWQHKLDHGFKYEFVSRILDNGDGTWTVISRGNSTSLCLSEYNSNGKELICKKIEIGNVGIQDAVRLGDGYLIRTWGSYMNDIRLIKLDRDGNIIDSFTYNSDDCDYYITDMIEYGGKVYLSAYAVPKQSDEGGRDEIGNILRYLFDRDDQDDWDISSEELTPIVRDNYTAVLLVCETDSGEPKSFYSVKGSLGGKLDVNESGELVWDVESISSTYFSPCTSSFTVGGKCNVFRYIFERSGKLLSQVDTGEIGDYRR